jgi:hypothetical protein
MAQETEERGTFRCYIPKKFNASTLELIGKINQIVDDYEAQGFSLTVRQIHYQFVSRDWLPNTASTYNRLQSAINDGRLAGLISWTAIEDRGRALMGLGHYTSPSQAIARARASYRTDLWADQPWRPEVWVEKQALEGVIGSICNELRLDYYACKGYNSQSMAWEAGQRFADYTRKGQRVIVFHLGDHDPSGVDMTRDNQERLSMFTGVPIIVQRLALTLSQIDEYEPPPNYLKEIGGRHSDSRAASYMEMMEDVGREDVDSSWELDALDPPVIHDLIRDAVDRIRDAGRWDAALKQEVQDKQLLDEMIDMLGGKSGEEQD